MGRVHNTSITSTSTARCCGMAGRSLFVLVFLVTTSEAIYAKRITDGLIALYPLDEGSGTIVHDLSPYRDPVDLPLVPGDLEPVIPGNPESQIVKWFEGGLSIRPPGTEIASPPGVATKLYSALTASEDIIIEVWIEPANKTQGNPDAPVPIVAMAHGQPGNRNFYLAQADGEYVGITRYEDPVRAEGKVAENTLQHVVFTRNLDANTANIYVQGKRVANGRSIYSFASYFDRNYPFALASWPESDRPWLGKVHLVAIYDRALTAVEISQNFLMGANTPGDFNGDAVLDARDIDLLSKTVRSDDTNTAFDLNRSGRVDQEDRRVWVEDKETWWPEHQYRHTYFGDSNLDGEFNSKDFVQVFQAGEYEDQLLGNSGWAEGDWNGDADFDSGDFVFAFRLGGYELGPRAAVSVPEASGPVSLCYAISLLCVHLAWHRGSVRNAGQATGGSRSFYCSAAQAPSAP